MARKINQELKNRILKAGEALFTQKGFHGVSIRDIAREANTSVSNLYAYFPSKEALFQNLFEEYEKAYFQDSTLSLDSQKIEEVDLVQMFQQMGIEIHKKVKKFSNYIRLIYVDVVEFQGLHIQKILKTMRSRYKTLYGPLLMELQKKGDIRKDIDPFVGLMSLSMAYFNFFTVELIFGALRHYGISLQKGIAEIAKIYAYAFLESEKKKQESTKKKNEKNIKFFS